MLYDGKRWQRWTGRQWDVAAYSLDPDRLLDPTPLRDEPRRESSACRGALDRAVANEVAVNAASIVFDGPGGVVLSYLRPVSHGLHAVVTLLTAGLWAVVWIVMSRARTEDRVRLEVDDWGNVWAVRTSPR